jgi:hypothetical protein
MAATNAAWPHIPDRVRIAFSQAAFDAIAGTMALGSVGLAARPGESYSDVILRLSEG